VTDVVKSVERLGLKRLEQSTERRSLQPMKLHRSYAGQARQRPLQVVTLALDVELFIVGGARDDPEQPQRWLHEQRAMGPWQIEVSDHRCERRYGQEIGLVEQVLPGNVDQLRRPTQAQRDPDASVLASRMGQGVPVQLADRALEQRTEQPAPEAARVGDRGSLDPPPAARSAHLQDEALDLELVERQLEAR
jgi:hypothetical protein